MPQMQLGAFSCSLAVKDIEASRQFYEKFGFAPVMGDASTGWMILTGPASFMPLDPDGNPVLVEQHR